jgi:hypothetical protein
MWLSSPTGPGRLAADAGEETAEGVFFVEAGAFVEERLELLGPELAGEVLHGRLIGAGVAEEDFVAGHR